jgi:acyl-CoA thioesterase I
MAATREKREKTSMQVGLATFFSVICLAAWGCTQESGSSSPPPQSKPAGIIVAFGDSLTEGYGLDESEAWPALLEDRLKQEGKAYRVINAGVSGETSQGALSRVDWILRTKPDIVILETGANDGMRGTDPQVTRENIDKIVEQLQSNGVTVVLAGMKMLVSLGASFARSFDALYPEIAKERKVIFIPFILDGIAGVRGLNLSDGIHPNAKGHRLMMELIYPYVVKAITG